MQNDNSIFGSLFSPQRVIPRVRLKFRSWKGNRRSKNKDREELPYFGVSYKTDDVEAHLLPFHQKSQYGKASSTCQPNKYPNLQTFQGKSCNNCDKKDKQNNSETKAVVNCSTSGSFPNVASENLLSARTNDKYLIQTPTTNWLMNEGEENERTRRKTFDTWNATVPESKHLKQRKEQKSGVELLLEVSQYIKDIFMWLDYEKKGYVPYSAVKILCLLLNKTYPTFDDTCNSDSENDKCNDKFCKQHLRFEKFSFILRHCFEKEEALLPNLSKRQSTVLVTGVPRRLELLKNIISSINKLDSYRKFWNLSEDSSARNGLHFDAFKNSNISIISREVELKRRILFQQQEINGLREIIEGLRIALQSSDAENLCLHVRLRIEEKPPCSQPFYVKTEHRNNGAIEMQRSYSCESIESGFQTSFESVTKLKQDLEMTNEYSADSDYQNLSKDDDIDYLRRKLRKAYSKIHRVNRELESLKFTIIESKKDKERMHELQSQIEVLKAQMDEKDVILNNTRKECYSLKYSRSRMVSELLKVRTIISDLCFKVKKQEKTTKTDKSELLMMSSLDCGSSTDSLEEYSETSLEKPSCDNFDWNKYNDISSDSSSTLNLSSKSEEEGEYIINHKTDPRFLPKPPRINNSYQRNTDIISPKTGRNNLTQSSTELDNYRVYPNQGNMSYYKCTDKLESKKILDNLEEEMKLLQYNLDNGKW